MLWVCFKLPFCLFDHTRDMSVIYVNVKFACFIYISPIAKSEIHIFSSNMKQVLYMLTIGMLQINRIKNVEEYRT